MKKNNSVLYISLVVVFAIVFWGILSPENFESAANGLYELITINFSWLYLISMFIFVAFSLFIAFSKYGNIRLGPDDSKPDFKTSSWFAMLFGAGMGIGLVFFGVAEPLKHFVSPPFGLESGTAEAANFAIKSSFVHWGFHPWANYSIIGLALAYFQYRKNKPGLISTIFIPLIGEDRVNGPIGKIIDILAVFATVAGVATSLGLGTLQINGGLNYLFGIPYTTFVQIIIIVIVLILYTWTAVSGVEKGIKILSDINLLLAIVILVGSILIGPTLKMVNSFTNGLGTYISQFVSDSFHIEAFGDNTWISDWTIFYWAWWIAWAPFVGTFIARISRGRTVREFILGVIIAPSIASFIWFSVFGTLGIDLGVDIASSAAKVTETALFVVLKNYPLGNIISVIAVLLLCTFFITSANSATFVLGMFTSGGDLNPSNTKKIIWGVIQAMLALALMLAGGLKTLQIGSVAAAFPFIFVMLLACVSIYKALKSETTIK